MATMPATNTEFWVRKFTENVRRDAWNVDQLRKLGWNAIVIWECELGKPVALDDLFWRILAASAAGVEA